MTFYRSRTGDLVEAARFKGGHITEEPGMCFGYGEGDFSWLVDAMNNGTLETSAFGTGLILNHRGGSYGLAIGDYVIRKRGGELTHCRGDRFAEMYEAV